MAAVAAVAAVRRTSPVAFTPRAVSYSEVASGRRPLAAVYVTSEEPTEFAAVLPVVAAAGFVRRPIAQGTMDCVVVPAAPPPPTSVGAVVTKMLPSPAPGAAPRFAPRTTSVPPFWRVKLAAVKVVPVVPGVTLIVETPSANVIAPTVSAEAAVPLPDQVVMIHRRARRWPRCR